MISAQRPGACSRRAWVRARGALTAISNPAGSRSCHPVNALSLGHR